MNILILNWRDIKNPKSGGAEILTHEIAKRLIKKGHKVIQFSSKFNGAKSEEIINGVKIMRRGNPDARSLFLSVHFLAMVYYFKNFKGKVDVVIDEVHGLPFFTPLYVKEKKIMLVCEVAGELWQKMFGPFFGTIGRLAEWFFLHFIYRSTPFFAISNSTKSDLIKEGVDEKNIRVLPMGISFPPRVKKFEKEKSPVLIFVGRLIKSKGIEDAIYTFKEASREIKNLKLWIVGRGDEEYLESLKKLARKLGVENKIIFHGYVSEEKKFELMGRAWILVAPSVKEGWGLTIPEAASQGTPSIAYDVEGLRDVLINGVNGLKVRDKKEMREAAVKLIKDKDLYEKLKISAKKSSFRYNWDNTAKFVEGIIK